ncbi:RpiB/LacA/LacB family sugar-phosphate isomerase [Pseudonocardiaceae bacterium YIM PH 21723]|nr:RpiB/LacA/LacB family sugar-phosphate isomerase [Pseudonocardiaceae bacterium YIM PH 21723]
MRIAFAADDSNAVTRAIEDYLADYDYEVVVLSDAGGWPDLGAAVGRAVAGGEADLGILLCWTGTGVSIAANKVDGVRAALAWEPWVAEGARKWNDANVLALSLKRLAPDVAVEIVGAFLTPVHLDHDEEENIAKIAELEA